ncbi:MAG: peroxiredoxin family protein [Acidobacteriota bacterium]
MSKITVLSVIIFLISGISLNAQETNKLKVNKTVQKKPEWETSVMLKDSSVIRVFIENGWINAEHKNTKNELLWRTIIAKGSKKSLPRIERENKTVKISDASGRYFIKTPELAFGYRFITGNLEDALKEGAEGFSPKDYGTDLVQPHSSGDDYSLKWLEKDGWKYLSTGSYKSDNVIGLFRITHEALTEELFNRTIEVTGHANTLQDGVHHFFWDGNFLYAEETSDFYMLKSINSNLVLNNAQAPEFSVKKWFNAQDSLSVSSLKGKVVLLYFWSYTCWPTAKPMKKLQYLSDKYKSEGLEVVTILPEENEKYIGKYLEENPGVKITVGLDSGKTRKDYGIMGEGRFFIIDRSGKIIKSYLQMIPTENTIADLLRTNL